MDYISSCFSYFSEDPPQSPSPEWAESYPTNLNILPDIERDLEWHEETETRNLVSLIFSGFGCLAVGGAVFTAILITEPIAAIIIAVICALAAIILFALGLYVYLMEPCELDPVYRMQKREMFFLQPTIPSFSSMEIATQGKIIYSHEVQTILMQDIQDKSFDDFIETHKLEGLRFLDEGNIALIRPKWIDSLLQFRDQGMEKLDEILKSEEAQIFNLKIEELLPHFAPEEWEQQRIEKDLLKLDYQSFVALHGIDTLQSFQPEYLECLRPDFIVCLKKSLGGEEYLKTNADQTETERDEDSSGFLASSWKQIGSFVSPLIPTQVKNIGQCAILGLQLARNGQLKGSAIAFGTGITCAAGMALNAEIGSEFPEAARIAKDQLKFESLFKD